MEILMAVDSVLFDEKKSSTYKFALMTAIADYIVENPNEYTTNGMHYIPLIYLAKRWLYYYGPLLTWNQTGVKQTSSAKLAIRTSLEKYWDNNSNAILLDGQPQTILPLKQTIESNRDLEEKLIHLLIDIRGKIIKQPLRYIKVADNINDDIQFQQGINIKQTSFTLFGLLNTSISANLQQDYEEIRKQSMRWYGTTTKQPYLDLEGQEQVFIQMGHYTYTEFSKSRLFLKDAIIKRWIEFSIDNYIKNDPAEIMALFEGLQLHTKMPERNSTEMSKFRDIASDIFNPMTCIYCLDPLQEFELDHFIPWSKLPINRFWNLFPSCKSCNQKKTDHIINMEPLIIDRLENYLEKWLDYIGEEQSKAMELGGNNMHDLVGKDRKSRIGLLIDQLLQISQHLL